MVEPLIFHCKLTYLDSEKAIYDLNAQGNRDLPNVSITREVYETCDRPMEVQIVIPIKEE